MHKSRVLLIDENISRGGGVRTVLLSVVDFDPNLQYIYADITQDHNDLLTRRNVKNVTLLPSWRALARKFNIFKFVVALLLVLRRNEFSVIYVHQPKSLVIGFAIGWLTGRPVIYHCHGLSGGAAPERLSPLFSFALMRVQDVLAISKFVMAQITRTGRVANVHLVYNWIEAPAVFDAESSRNVDYLFVGRICKDKDPLAFVRALQTLNSDFVAYIVGPTENEEYKDELLRQIGIDTRFSCRGLLSYSETISVIGSSKFMIVTSSWGEPFGLVLLEAMQQGTVVIARRDGAIPEIIDHGVNGLLFDSNFDLVNLLAEISNYPIESIIENAKKTITEKFNSKIQVSEIVGHLSRKPNE